MRKRNKVTIRDLAEELGLSDRSVSQALNPRKSNVQLNPETVKRIQQLAAKRNYLPDTSARAMRYGRYFNIGHFECSPQSVHYPLLGLDAGIFDAANEKNYRVVLVKLPSELANKQNPIPIAFRESHLDAMIVSHYGSLPPELMEAIDESKLPIVYLNEKRVHNSVYADDQGGSKEMTKFLVSQGYRKITFIQGFSDVLAAHYSTIDRLRGYTEAMEEAGFKSKVVRTNLSHEDEAIKWVLSNKDLEALICCDDLLSVRLFRILYKMGVKVPQQFAMASFGDLFSEVCAVSLTSVHIPYYEMGREAVGMALELIEHRSKKQLPSRVVKTSVSVRDSTPVLD